MTGKFERTILNTLAVKKSDTIVELKNEIQEKTGIPSKYIEITKENRNPEDIRDIERSGGYPINDNKSQSVSLTHLNQIGYVAKKCIS